MSVTLLDKWRLVVRISADEGLPQSAKVVAIGLLDCLNTESLQCNPSLEHLEHKSGLKRRSVATALAGLRSRGWIVQRRRRGTSYFAFNFDADEVQVSAPLTPDDVQETAPQTTDDEVQEAAPLEVQETACLHVQETAPLYRNREIETGNKKPGKISTRRRDPSRSKSALSETEIDAAFGDWWPRYPKHVDKLGARRRYGSVLKTGTATVDELNAGADGYRKQCQGRERKFIKSPEVWLNKGCWADEPEETPSPKPLNGTEAGHGWSNLDFGARDRGASKGQVIEAEFSHVD